MKSVHWTGLPWSGFPRVGLLCTGFVVMGLVGLGFGASSAIPVEDLSPLERVAVERAVRGGLDFLARQQHEQGHWQAEDGGGNATTDIGVTALAVLAFVESGSTHRDGPYAGVLRRALGWLTKQTGLEVEGLIGDRSGQYFMYNHALAALAVCEVYRLTKDPELEKVCRPALDFIARARNPGKVWRYYFPPTGREEDNDMSVTGWMLYALVAGRDAGLTVDEAALEAGERFIDEMTDPQTFRTGYNRRGGRSVREEGDEMRWPPEQVEAMTAVAIACRQVLRKEPPEASATLRGSADLLAKKLPLWVMPSIDFYYWYAGTRALQLVGEPYWTPWRRAVAEALVLHQVETGEAAGSWDPAVDPWGDVGGRLYTTALAVTSLQKVLREGEKRKVVQEVTPRLEEQGEAVAKAISAGLDWLARHQHEQGHWGAASFEDECEGEVCSGEGNATCDVGVTGLALLAFLEQGNTVTLGEYKETVERGLRWLKNFQGVEVDGLFGDRSGQYFMYNHAIATLATCQGYGLSNWPLLRRPAQDGLDFIGQSRNPNKVWRYYFPPTGRAEDNDMSVTGWMLFALAFGKHFGLTVDEMALKAGAEFIDEMTDPKAWRTGYNRRGGWSAREPGDEVKWPYENFETMTAVALYARELLAPLQRSEALNKEVAGRSALLSTKLPVWAPGFVEYYYWYAGTVALRVAGRGDWLKWQEAVRRALVDHQVSEGCAKGSWDPAMCPWGDVGGRVYSTALGTLTLIAAF
ncbi:MAG: prenyltransferase/squalene oxidase repeat-containing protein [Planctomycetota bacterium]